MPSSTSFFQYSAALPLGESAGLTKLNLTTIGCADAVPAKASAGGGGEEEAADDVHGVSRRTTMTYLYGHFREARFPDVIRVFP